MQIEVTPWKVQLRILKSTRHLSRSILTHHSLPVPYSRRPLSPSNNHHINNPRFRIKCASLPPPIPNPFSLLLSLSATHHLNDKPPPVGSDTNDNGFSWNRAPPLVNGGGDLGRVKDKGTLYTVVMLGWLGSEQKHLKRYIELYASKGIHSLSFVVPVRDLLGFDLGRRVENRISALSNELISWLSQTQIDGRERGLIFHTFSNTGWLVYGAILDYLQSRGEFIDKIKGCVVDSGPDPELNPQASLLSMLSCLQKEMCQKIRNTTFDVLISYTQDLEVCQECSHVWAAGFSAALLKKRSSATLPSVESTKGYELETNKVTAKVQNTEPILVETFLLSVLEMFFSLIFKLPDVNRRLTKIITTLSKNQPPCPQLYLYSTSDKVVPSGQVDMFIHGQKMLGREVWACNFGSSPHVDHYRTFPQEYSAELNRFIERIITLVH